MATYALPGNRLEITDATHVADAITALGPGFRGHKADVTPAERKTAIAAIRRRIGELGLSDEAKQHLLDRLGSLHHKSAFYITKQADGSYRWYGFPTNNALDRDNEILPAHELEKCIKQQKQRGEWPDLFFFHIHYPVGKTDYMGYTDGVVYATGPVNKDAVSQKFAEYVSDHPASYDGSGWGMSHAFLGEVGADGIYKVVRNISEFTFLAMSVAANPYTSFGVEVKKMREDQKRALDLVLQDKSLIEVVLQHQTAQKMSEDLDAQGVRRKESSELGGQDEAMQTQFEQTKAVAGAAGFDQTQMSFQSAGRHEATPNAPEQGQKDLGAVRGPGLVMGNIVQGTGASMNTQHGQNAVSSGITDNPLPPCAACGHSAQDHTVLGTKAVHGYGKCTKCTKCTGYQIKSDDEEAGGDEEGDLSLKRLLARESAKLKDDGDEEGEVEASRGKKDDDGADDDEVEAARGKPAAAANDNDDTKKDDMEDDDDPTEGGGDKALKREVAQAVAQYVNEQLAVQKAHYEGLIADLKAEFDAEFDKVAEHLADVATGEWETKDYTTTPRRDKSVYEQLTSHAASRSEGEGDHHVGSARIDRRTKEDKTLAEGAPSAAEFKRLEKQFEESDGVKTMFGFIPVPISSNGHEGSEQ